MIVEGQCELIQESIVEKHIDLDFIMYFINRLYQTRRVKRDFYRLNKNYAKKVLKYNIEDYGLDGEYYIGEEIPESIKHNNDYGINPSLSNPFFVIKENNKYYLKCDYEPSGNDLESIELWLVNFTKYLSYLNGIYFNGYFNCYDVDEKEKYEFKLDEKGSFIKIEEKNDKDENFRKNLDRKSFIDKVNNNKLDKEDYYPPIFYRMAEDIEKGELNIKEELKKMFSTNSEYSYED
jgi:hypothetical protein